MNPEQAEEYTQALGQVVAGSWRQIALGRDLGVPKALGLSVDQWVQNRLGGYVKLSIPERREAVAELTSEGLSTRAAAEVLGVDQATVVRDANASAASDVSHDEAGADGDADANASPSRQEKRRNREEALRYRRDEAERRARESGLRCEIVAGDVATWRPQEADAIVTDPPYVTVDAVELHSALADFALDVLPDGGPLLVMTWQPILADVVLAMTRPGLIYRWTIAWTFETNERTPDHARRVFDGWKPILVFHKGRIPKDATYVYDVVRSENLDKQAHEWGQALDGFRRLIRAASEPGDTICDPFTGGGTTAVAALAEGRHFVGCDIDGEAVVTATERLAA